MHVERALKRNVKEQARLKQEQVRVEKLKNNDKGFSIKNDGAKSTDIKAKKKIQNKAPVNNAREDIDGQIDSHKSQEQ